MLKKLKKKTIGNEQADEQSNKTRVRASNNIAFTDINNRILAIIKYAEPLVDINNSNNSKIEISDSDSDKKPIPKHSKIILSNPLPTNGSETFLLSKVIRNVYS